MTRYQPRYSLTSTKGSQKEALNETSVISHQSSWKIHLWSYQEREKSGAWRQSLQYEILIQAVRDRDALNTCRNTSLLHPLISRSWIIHFHLHPSIFLSLSLCVSLLPFFVRKAQSARGRLTRTSDLNTAAVIYNQPVHPWALSSLWARLMKPNEISNSCRYVRQDARWIL